MIIRSPSDRQKHHSSSSIISTSRRFQPSFHQHHHLNLTVIQPTSISSKIQFILRFILFVSSPLFHPVRLEPSEYFASLNRILSTEEF
ncbi:hypothetical protein L2E82_37636 [Cichorium intybus]|uniref:Uncharacterized protein n=1 Tax=Cichorium intybus TaxID=13427 RepID=A0ACB9AFE9_CICIN|nr:hypothetical protein L2E82_37636 [Cichorium intybus]